MSKSINHNVFLAQSPEDVWEYLTRPELIELWLMQNNFQPTVGHQFQFHTMPMPNHDFDGNVYCTVLEVKPFTNLSYSWKGGPGDGRITLDSIVVWILVPRDNGTELQLVHSGFKETENMFGFTIMSDGWLKSMYKIGELIKMAKDGANNT